MKGALLLVMAVGGIVSVGCGDDRLRTLSQSDVVGIPAGDATGSLFAGQYMLTRAWKGPCRCRAGSCATLNLGLGSATLMQTDGGAAASQQQSGCRLLRRWNRQRRKFCVRAGAGIRGRLFFFAHHGASRARERSTGLDEWHLGEHDGASRFRLRPSGRLRSDLPRPLTTRRYCAAAFCAAAATAVAPSTPCCSS